MSPDLSIIIPVYNEEECLPLLEAELSRVIEDLPMPVEVIFVDDGSTDRSFAHLVEITERRPWARVIRLRRNFGQTQAMAAGFDHARGGVLVCLDADLQNDPADIPRLLECMDQGYDIVSGWRKNRRDRLLTRRIPSWCANRIISWWMGVRIHDYGCSLKAYNANVMKALHLYSDMHRFLPALAWQCGARITEIPVNHRPRLHGRSKYGISRVFKVVVDLMVIKLIVGFSHRPAHAFGKIGTLFLVACLLILPIFIWNVIVGYRVNIVLPAILILLALCSVYFFILGVLGDLILRVGHHDAADHARSTAVEVS